jgi:hypothetical protein
MIAGIHGREDSKRKKTPRERESMINRSSLWIPIILSIPVLCISVVSLLLSPDEYCPDGWDMAVS